MVRPFLAKKRLNYPVVIASESLTKAYGLEAMPVTVLIDRQGRVAVTYQGMIDRAACDRAIQSLLHESAGTLEICRATLERRAGGLMTPTRSSALLLLSCSVESASESPRPASRIRARIAPVVR